MICLIQYLGVLEVSLYWLLLFFWLFFTYSYFLTLDFWLKTKILQIIHCSDSKFYYVLLRIILFCFSRQLICVESNCKLCCHPLVFHSACSTQPPSRSGSMQLLIQILYYNNFPLVHFFLAFCGSPHAWQICQWAEDLSRYGAYASYFPLLPGDLLIFNCSVDFRLCTLTLQTFCWLNWARFRNTATYENYQIQRSNSMTPHISRVYLSLVSGWFPIMPPEGSPIHKLFSFQTNIWTVYVQNLGLLASHTAQDFSYTFLVAFPVLNFDLWHI